MGATQPPREAAETVVTNSSSTPQKSAPSRRDEILRVAAELFSERGFEATSIREIADAAGILPGSLYHHFASKEEMLHDLLKPFVESLAPGYEAVIASSGGVVDTLSQLINEGLKISLQYTTELSILMQERKFLQRNRTFRYVSTAMQEVDRIWYGVLQEGVRSKAFSAELDLNLVLRTIMDLLASVAAWYTPDSRYSPEEIAQTHIALLLNGLLLDTGQRDNT